MDEALISNWNERVRPGDRVYHGGDLSFHRDRDRTDAILDRLHGQIHLVEGNHDAKRLGYYRHRLASLDTLKEIRIDGQKIVICHYALRVWNRSHLGAWHLYGHSHGNLADDPNSLSMDMGVDPNDYRPLSMDDVAAHMATKTWVPVDHHGAD